jgi:alpha-tubulin suppressor-like RCC1 family protein
MTVVRSSGFGAARAALVPVAATLLAAGCQALFDIEHRPASEPAALVDASTDQDGVDALIDVAQCSEEPPRCVGNVVETCDDRTWTQSTPCELPSPACSNGACQAVQSLATGLAWTHSCAVLADGSVQCWGANENGELGRGTLTAFELRPGPVAGLSNVKQVSLGQQSSCALEASGSVWCWGGNAAGQIDASSQDPVYFVPAQIAGITDAVELNCGFFHCCVRTGAGRIRCWGQNSFAQLGSGKTSAAEGATDVGIDDALAVAVGEAHSCAIIGSEQVQCWGRNQRKQIGDNAGGPMRPEPSTVLTASSMPLTGTKHISLGAFHSCATTGDGTTYCWGANDFGGLGIGDFGDRGFATPTQFATGARTSAGNRQTCALQGTAASCAGLNQAGQLGNGTVGAGTEQTTPTPVAQLEDSVELSMQFDHSCARSSAGQVRCWGRNSRGQLGNWEPAQQSAWPVAVRW